MTKEEISKRLPSTPESAIIAKEIYNGCENDRDLIRGFVDGIKHAKMKLLQRNVRVNEQKL